MRVLPAMVAAAIASPITNISAPLVSVTIPVVPAPVQSDGSSVTAFEIVLTYDDPRPIDLTDLSVADARDHRLLVRFTGPELSSRVAGDEARSAKRGAANRVRIYIELNSPKGEGLRALVATVGYRDRSGTRREVLSRPTSVDTIAPVVLDPPLKGGPWVAVHAPDWERGHRRMVYALGGRERIPGRYAVDWVGVDDDGKIASGDPDRPSDATGYGAAVLAGAAGVVAVARDGMQEGTSIAQNPAQPLGSGSGNFVVLMIGPRRYVFYEHLKPGSIRVQRGQHVRAGQEIGALGFTGDSTGPHLHMHVADCPAPLACEGVPFRVRRMNELGRYLDIAELGKRRWDVAAAHGRIGPEWPGYNVVVRFE